MALKHQFQLHEHPLLPLSSLQALVDVPPSKPSTSKAFKRQSATSQANEPWIMLRASANDIQISLEVSDQRNG